MIDIEQELVVSTSKQQPQLFEDLVQETHELLSKKKSMEGEYVETIIKIGGNLNKMQSHYNEERKGYGQFIAFVEKEFKLKRRTIHEYRCIATVYGRNVRHAAHLPDYPERVLAVLSAPSTTEEVRQLVEAGVIPPTREAIRSANKARKAMKKVEQWVPEEQIVEGTVESSEVIEEEETNSESDQCRILEACPIAKLYEHIEAESLNAIVTDPPYPHKYLDVYSDLADFAIHALKPGGSLIVMVGQSYLPEIMDMLRKDPLKYHWLCCYYVPGSTTKQWQRNLGISWKPLLWFVKGEYTGPWKKDVIKKLESDSDHIEDDADHIFVGTKKDKKYHEWGQPVDDMVNILNHFTLPDQVVCDPFVGGGSTAVAAIQCGRHFIGCDIDEQCVLKTKQRVKEAKEAMEFVKN